MKFIFLFFNLCLLNCYADENSVQLPMHFYYEWIHPKNPKDVRGIDQNIKFYSERLVTNTSKPVITLSPDGIVIYSKKFSVEDIVKCFEMPSACEKSLKDAEFLQKDGKSLLVHLFYEDEFLQSVLYEGKKYYSNLHKINKNVVFDDGGDSAFIIGAKANKVFKNVINNDTPLKEFISKIKDCAKKESYACMVEISKIEKKEELIKSLKVREALERTIKDSKIENLSELHKLYKFNVKGDNKREPVPNHVYDKISEYPNSWEMLDRIFQFKEGTYDVAIQSDSFQLKYFTITFKKTKFISYRKEFEARIILNRDYDNDKSEWSLVEIQLYPFCDGDSCQ